MHFQMSDAYLHFQMSAGVQLPDHNAASMGGPEAPIREHSQPEGRPQK